MQLKKILSAYKWKIWLNRPFYGFIMSTFNGGNTKQAFKKIRLAGWSCDFLFSNGKWFASEKAYVYSKKPILKWLANHKVEEISNRLEKSRLTWLKKIKEFSKNPNANTLAKLKYLDAILREITTYVWAVHMLEHYFSPMLRKLVSKYVHGNIDKYIGDVSFPEKLNSAELMVQKYKNGAKPSVLAKEFGWMRARDGFSEPYSALELVDIAKHALKQPPHKIPEVQPELLPLVKQARELVYLRMLRMDVYYEIMFWAKPLLKAVARQYNMPFKNLKFYTLTSLITKRPQFYPIDYSCVSIKGKTYFYNYPIISEGTNTDITEIKGTIAQPGKVQGKVTILMKVQDLQKVKNKDILVTYMTSPNFLPAMKKAAAFVTDEGGLTCHAAIVAREMKKPCIIGTKIATKVFKDGDMVEVDANQGIVKKLTANS